MLLLLFNPEGSRSRTGKAMVPKSGLLSLVVNAVTEGNAEFSFSEISFLWALNQHLLQSHNLIVQVLSF